MKRRKGAKPRAPVRVREVIASCPNCGAFETIWIRGKTLVPTQKFYQRQGKIYHKCGKHIPCLLLKSWGDPDD